MKRNAKDLFEDFDDRIKIVAIETLDENTLKIYTSSLVDKLENWTEMSFACKYDLKNIGVEQTLIRSGYLKMKVKGISKCDFAEIRLMNMIVNRNIHHEACFDHTMESRDIDPDDPKDIAKVKTVLEDKIWDYEKYKVLNMFERDYKEYKLELNIWESK